MSTMKARDACLPLLTLFLLCSTWISAAQKPKPQNKGGVHLVLAVTADGSRVDEIIARTVAVIRKRCRLLGITCKFQRQLGEKANRLELDVSTRMSADRVKGILLAEGLELRAVVSPRFPELMLDYPTRSQAMAAAGANNDVFPSPGEEMYLIAERIPFFTGDDLGTCIVLRSEENFKEYEVDCRLKSAGAARLEAWTGANINRYIALIFNHDVLSAAYIKAPIYYNVVVSGGFSKGQAQDAAVVLQSGNLLELVELVEEGTQSPRGPLAVSRHR